MNLSLVTNLFLERERFLLLMRDQRQCHLGMPRWMYWGWATTFWTDDEKYKWLKIGNRKSKRPPFQQAKHSYWEENILQAKVLRAWENYLWGWIWSSVSSDGKIQMYIYWGMEQMGEYKATQVFIPGQILLFFTYFSYHFLLFHCYFIGGLQIFCGIKSFLFLL